MVEITLEITQQCPNQCFFCSSDATPTGKHLDYNVVIQFLEQIRHEDVERINISGGEPLSHPRFYEILQCCYILTDNVWVYTNALRKIMYNTFVLDEVEVEANVCIVPGSRVYIPRKPGKIHLLKMIHQGRAACLEGGPEVVVSRNFWDEEHCADCNHLLLQADGKVVPAPCKKEYS